MKKDVMLDLETMGKGANAAIIAIGAVAFDLADGDLSTTFYRIMELM